MMANSKTTNQTVGERSRRVMLGLVCVLVMLFATACGGQKELTHLDKARASIGEYSYAAAIEESLLALASGEDAAEAYRLMGIAHFKSAAYNEAEEAFISSLSYSSGIPATLDYDMNLYIAACRRGKGDNKAAVRIYDNILALNPGSVEALYERGVTFLEMQELAKATGDFDLAISYTPRDYSLRLKIYQAYTLHGHEPAGKLLLQEALANYEAAMSSYEKGRFNFYLGNNALAQSQLELALDSSDIEERAQAAYLLGQTGEKQGDLGYAIEVYTAVLDAYPTYANLFNRRGLCYMQQGKYAAAVADFEAGLALGYSDVYQMLLRNEAAAYEYAGDFQKAKKVMQKYISLFPDDLQAARDLLFLETR